MKVLVTGANGFVGARLMRLLRKNSFFQLVGTDINVSPWNHTLPIVRAELSDSFAMEKLLEQERPDAIVLNGALKGLEQCRNSTRACEVNLFSIQPFLAYAIRNPQTFLVFISSDMVFGRCQTPPFDEMCPPAASNAYGQMKIAGEELLKLAPNWAVVRTALVYGPMLPEEKTALNAELRFEKMENQSLLIHWVSERTLNGLEVSLAENVYCTPTFIDDLTAGIEKILQNQFTGIFHCSGNCRISRLDLGLLAAQVKGNPELVRGFISPKDLIRPLDVSLDNRKTAERLNLQTTPIEIGVRLSLEEGTKG